jgi:hypothetical protein
MNEGENGRTGERILMLNPLLGGARGGLKRELRVWENSGFINKRIEN